MTTAVIFDLYGTLIHLQRNTRPYSRLCRSTGTVTRLRESLIIDAPTLSDFCNHLDIPIPSDMAEIEHELAADVAKAALFHDTVSTLQNLRERGVRLGLISNLASPYKLPFFALGLDANFDAMIFSCDIGVTKPDPSIYQQILAELSVDADDALMVGDSKRCDVDGPEACGIRGFLLDREGKSSDGSCLESLSDVTTILTS